MMRGCWLILLLAAGPVAAQTSYPMITSVYPAGLQRGTTAEIEVTGSGNLAGASRVLFEGAGLEIVFTALSARLQDTVHDLAPGGGGPHSDLMLVLSDAEGREIASNDDYYRADPMLAQRFEKAGDYFLTVRDVRYAGHPTW